MIFRSLTISCLWFGCALPGKFSDLGTPYNLLTIFTRKAIVYPKSVMISSTYKLDAKCHCVLYQSYFVDELNLWLCPASSQPWVLAVIRVGMHPGRVSLVRQQILQLL